MLPDYVGLFSSAVSQMANYFPIALQMGLRNPAMLPTNMVGIVYVFIYESLVVLSGGLIPLLVG